MSYIEHPDSWFPEFTIESGNGKYDMVAKMIDSKKKCCDNCDYFDTFTNFDLRAEDGLCLKNVANDEYGAYIKDSDTFYCSYHKFKD